MWVPRGGERGDPQRSPMTWVPPACAHRALMDITTFEDNFGVKREKKTYLCYEVEVLEGDAWAPMEEHQGFLRNQGADTPWEPRRHAELCFLDRVRSWRLDRGKHYRLTWYISWSPCPGCALKLVKFLRENSHVSLHVFASRIYSFFSGYERGLRDLQDAEAQLAIMTLKEHQHCWETFVDNQDQPFEPWPNMEEDIRAQSQKLENILRVRFLPSAPPLSSPLPFSPWACLSLWVTCSLLGPSFIPPFSSQESLCSLPSCTPFPSPPCDCPRLCSVLLPTCLTPCSLHLLLLHPESGKLKRGLPSL
ncbi:hypothetical protein QTO34_018037 [Cnephaeus nilssonii]|uniref:DNA dC->dU-editing enzyme APOBEC-3G n=1 Tax=Cnephaeus nilssonii TaxID=3371016 RepID=A0AA40I329_CNENI|nr:hypothetical protein QTO34_018037 [Eptesicus nilssonii]